MIFVVSALARAKVREIMDELDRRDPFHHLEPELILAAQPKWRAVQHADGRSVHFVGEDGQLVAHVGYLMHVIVTPGIAAVGE